jgi:outer membrane protein TolC
MAYQRLFQSQVAFNSSRKDLYPNLDAAGSLAYTKYGDYTENGVGNYDLNLSSNITPDQKIPSPVPDAFIGLQTSWEIGFAGKMSNREKTAYYKYLASEDGKNFVQTQLVANVAWLYYELLSIDNQLKIIRKNLNMQEKAMEIVAIQKISGQINELAVKQFNVQLLNTKSIEAEKAQQAIEIENDLNTLLGRYPQHIHRNDTLLNDNQLSFLYTGLPNQMLQNRPDIREAEKNLHANEAQLKSVRAAFFPGLNISAFFALNGFNLSFFFNPASLAYMVAGSLTAPILNRNQIMKEYMLQASDKKQAFLDYQKVVFTAVNEVSSSYSRTLTFQHIANLKQKELDELKLATGIANDLFLTGYANYLEVLTVRKSVLDSELQLTEARKEFFNAFIDLYKATGGGWQ